MRRWGSRKTKLMSELVAGHKQCRRNGDSGCAENSGHKQRNEGIEVAATEKTVAKAVDHVEEGVEKRRFGPEIRQLLNRIEDP